MSVCALKGGASFTRSYARRSPTVHAMSVHRASPRNRQAHAHIRSPHGPSIAHALMSRRTGRLTPGAITTGAFVRLSGARLPLQLSAMAIPRQIYLCAGMPLLIRNLHQPHRPASLRLLPLVIVYTRIGVSSWTPTALSLPPRLWKGRMRRFSSQLWAVCL
ncbi:hypothetical protein HYPSUDRAFT_914408 [Hypholoma sublateritium FD-334 SS-4]|uniref:Uncharacterized protein n=1 Tax=Hypholoma sublateritium (strain FD-334 SS-4) TaxID=945553 RepID=A0A0D2NIY9_HYPSF|nr:hypothetical protein HYPSUDRAFT_914408 [Hypholoma sublateritium FD-334 SS-4]